MYWRWADKEKRESEQIRKERECERDKDTSEALKDGL